MRRLLIVVFWIVLIVGTMFTFIPALNWLACIACCLYVVRAYRRRSVDKRGRPEGSRPTTDTTSVRASRARLQ